MNIPMVNQQQDGETQGEGVKSSKTMYRFYMNTMGRW